MTQVKIVIGAQYGDEGKGLTVDYLSGLHPESVVVRHCGGSQASHSVVRDGIRHAFRHFGSNSFLPNSKTYLSQYFICNPYVFEQEVLDLGYTPNISAHPDCLITTMVDMYINLTLEEQRGNQRHGSCGLGINETVERNLRSEFRLTLSDITDRESLIAKLHLIRNDWVLFRQKEMGIPQIPIVTDWTVNQEADFIRCQYLDVPIESALPSCEYLVFEGSQGLMLSERWCSVNKHVTRSHTGVRNAVSLLSTYPHDIECEVYYVTRAYTTRHGDGPLDHEVEGLLYPNIHDPNNIPNDNQGTIRYAPLDIDNLVSSIKHDAVAYLTIDYKVNLVVTCVDQLPEHGITFYKNNKQHTSTVPTFFKILRQSLTDSGLNVNKILTSTGPSATDVKETEY